MDSDLSKDYKKYAKKLGTVDPFKLIKSGKNESKVSDFDKAHEAYMSSISNDGINRVDDKPIGDLTKNVYCRIMTRDGDDDIGFVSLPPEKYQRFSAHASKRSGLSLFALKRGSVCHMTKFGLKDGTPIYLMPTNK